jgi:uncharacterized DUF497 family protein
LRPWASNGTRLAKLELTIAGTGVRMPEAIPVFDDPYAITITDDESDAGERRLITLGVGGTGRLLVVVYT